MYRKACALGRPRYLCLASSAEAKSRSRLRSTQLTLVRHCICFNRCRATSSRQAGGSIQKRAAPNLAFGCSSGVRRYLGRRPTDAPRLPHFPFRGENAGARLTLGLLMMTPDTRGDMITRETDNDEQSSSQGCGWSSKKQCQESGKRPLGPVRSTGSPDAMQSPCVMYKTAVGPPVCDVPG